jgi:hypothetical protein
MTEEDTFNRLKRLPMEEVASRWNEGSGTGILALYTHMNAHGWPLSDYLSFYYKKYSVEASEELWVKGRMDRYRRLLKENHDIDI